MIINKNINIEENKKKILQLFSYVERPGIDKVINFLKTSDYFVAPASTVFHGNYAGGLAHHSDNVRMLLKEKNERYDLGLTTENIIVSAYLHDICKVNIYKSKNRNVLKGTKKNYAGHDVANWVTQTGYEAVDLMPLRHSEKSIMMIQSMGFELEPCELFMIRWHMGAFEPKENYKSLNTAINLYPCVAAMHSADFEASNLLEETLEGDII